MKHVLVAYDGSEPARRALQLALRVAAPSRGRVTLMEVVMPFVFPADFAGVVPADLTQQQRAHVEAALEKAVTEAKATAPEGVTLGWEVRLGSPAEEVSRHAEEDVSVELVAVGSSGKGRVARMVMGSVADRLVRFSKKPVLVVH